MAGKLLGTCRCSQWLGVYGHFVQSCVVLSTEYMKWPTNSLNELVSCVRWGKREEQNELDAWWFPHKTWYCLCAHVHAFVKVCVLLPPPHRAGVPETSLHTRLFTWARGSELLKPPCLQSRHFTDWTVFPPFFTRSTTMQAPKFTNRPPRRAVGVQWELQLIYGEWKCFPRKKRCPKLSGT